MGSSPVPLALSNFLNEDGWEEAVFTVPKIGEQKGIGVDVDGCNDQYAKDLEFRADGVYKRFSLTAAPGRATEDSSKTLVVALYNNENFIDSKKIEYGSTATFSDVDISNVSALRIRVYNETDSCKNGGVFAVLYNISVSA